MSHKKWTRLSQIANFRDGPARNKVANSPSEAMVSPSTPVKQLTSQVGEETSRGSMEIARKPRSRIERKRRFPRKQTTEVHDTYGAARNKVASSPPEAMVSPSTPVEQQTSQVGEETSRGSMEIARKPRRRSEIKRRSPHKQTTEVHDTYGAARNKVASSPPEAMVSPSTPIEQQTSQAGEETSRGSMEIARKPRSRSEIKRRSPHKQTTEVHDTCYSRGASEECPNQPFVPAHKVAFKTRKIKQGANKGHPEVTPPRICHRGQLRRRLNNDRKSMELEKLDSNMFECYLENLWREFPDDKRISFTRLDCLWFSLYSKKFYKKKVLDWIKKKNILSKKYIFVPIVQWSHWSLLILCHFGESGLSESRTRCMLLLDSLQSTNPERLEPGIRRFILDIYMTEERSENKAQVNKIPLLIPKVPQQRNDKECGKFVLYYIKLFLENAPENFSISKGFPYFMTEDWFTYQGLESFNQRLDSIRRTDLDLSGTSCNDSSGLTDIKIIGTGKRWY